jgi:starch phosphorylase
VQADLARAPTGPTAPDGTIAYFSAEFGLHGSLPIYSGGLGALAGDILKEASDRALPMIAVGLLYRNGYFRQRIDGWGWQHEYWVDTDPERVPAALVSGADGRPLTITVPIWGRDVVAQIWRVDVGRVPLFLLDADRPENDQIARWVTSRLYVPDTGMRLAQYALLGIGGVRALDALGIDPAIVHLNEGHAAFVSLELACREAGGGGASLDAALESARRRTVFTTHTAGARRGTTLPAGARRGAARRRSPPTSASSRRAGTTRALGARRGRGAVSADPSSRCARAAPPTAQPPPRRGRARDVAAGCGRTRRRRRAVTCTSPRRPHAH